MKRAEDSPEAGGPCYTLYLEYLGGLVPILKGRRISKLRPEFVIMDPKTDSKAGESFNQWSPEEAPAAPYFLLATLICPQRHRSFLFNCGANSNK